MNWLSNANLGRIGAAALLLTTALLVPNAYAQEQQAAAAEEQEDAPLTLDELKVLTAPIALYPDDLVSLIISAEHVNKFFIDNMPAFGIGMFDAFAGPIEARTRDGADLQSGAAETRVLHQVLLFVGVESIPTPAGEA